MREERKMVNLVVPIARQLNIPPIAIDRVEEWWKVVWLTTRRKVGNKIVKCCTMVSKQALTAWGLEIVEGRLCDRVDVPGCQVFRVYEKVGQSAWVKLNGAIVTPHAKHSQANGTVVKTYALPIGKAGYTYRTIERDRTVKEGVVAVIPTGIEVTDKLPEAVFEESLKLPRLEAKSIPQEEFATAVRSRFVRFIAKRANEATKGTIGAILQAPLFCTARYWLDTRDERGDSDSERIKKDVAAVSKALQRPYPMSGRWEDGSDARPGFVAGLQNFICKRPSTGEYQIWHLVPDRTPEEEDAMIALGF